jgi:CheY-like chemotaxis protein
MDGYETAALIRSRKRTADTPIVFLTAIFRDEPHVFQAYSAGAVDVVFKPVDPFILKAKVRVFVELYLKTEEAKRQSAYKQWLLDEHARMKAEKVRPSRGLRLAPRRVLGRAILQVAADRVPFAQRRSRHSASEFVSIRRADTGFPPHRFTEEADFGSTPHPTPTDLGTGRSSGCRRPPTTATTASEFRWLCAEWPVQGAARTRGSGPSEDG